MNAEKNSKHNSTHVFLITDKVAQDDVEVSHIGMHFIWAGLNAKQVQ